MKNIFKGGFLPLILLLGLNGVIGAPARTASRDDRPAAKTAKAGTKGANREVQASPLVVSDLLWREVRNAQGDTLGSISDILVEMPSGRIVFIAVVPSGFFSRPKAVPPGVFSLPADLDDYSQNPMQADIPMNRWINAPRLDPDATLVIKTTEEGGRIYGYYQQAWQSPEPNASQGMTVVAQPKGAQPAQQYVSLKKLLWNRVTTPAWQQAGYVRNFLIDWNSRRVTHALVAPRFTPLVPKEAMWFAIPVPLLNPPIEVDAITVNADVEGFRRAAEIHEQDLPKADPTTIYLYPASPTF